MPKSDKKKNQSDDQPVSTQDRKSIGVWLILAGWHVQDVDAVRQCDICNRMVKVGLGGDLNFAQHERSKEHQKKLKKDTSSTSKLKDAALTRFFHRKPSSPQPNVPNPPGPSRLPTSSTLTSLLASSQPVEAPIDVDVIQDELPSPATSYRSAVIADDMISFDAGKVLLHRLRDYHLACRGLSTVPSGGWFCDDTCKENAGFRVRHQKRPRTL